MINARALNEEDLYLLEESLQNSEVHKNTSKDFFRQQGTLSTLYEDSNGPVLVIRGTKSLRLDIHFLDDSAVLRNGKTLIKGFEAVMSAAKASGFTEVVFDTKNEKLRLFCEGRFGFVAVEGDTLRKAL